ncbi:Receptor-like protein 12 [Glycine soja]|uniref:Receptor-like protein 12 n=1 Tax=Glycine soja TaxID=3848 RepID=A0A0B2RYL5_GLYSO|nr:Receptor-like protein 12 [Glycine soja]
MRNPHVSFFSIIFCYCFWIYHSVYFTGVSAHIVEDQQQSLLKLKNSLKFKNENSTKLVSWNSSIDCSEWRGVTCDKEGRVIGLDLSGESINGGLDNSSTLFKLQNLQQLNLAANNLGSEIPSGFNKLKRLTYLNLSHAGFVGFLPDKYMDGVSVSAQGNEWCNALLQLHSLQELGMSNCNLSGPLDPLLTRLENLSVIRLDQNNLSSSVPETFADFQNLTTLHLSSCELTGIFPDKIFKVATLSDIDLSFNYHLYGSLPEFSVNGPLRTLIVRDTEFSGSIPASINNLRQLFVIDTSNCYFNGTLSSSMSRLRELTYLDLSFNDFIGPIPSLNMSRNLVYLDLSHNDFTGSITSVHLEGLPKLVQFDLQDNFLNGNLPSLSGNIPHSLCNNSNLLVLDVSYNQFNGKIPECLTQSDTLVVLNLQHNQFNGSIPDKFPLSCALKTLDLNSNLLRGPIPKSLANCTSLEVLDLGNNQVDDGFPCFLKTISTLCVMVLRGNKFHGHIGCSHTNSTWHMLQIVDVAFNNFSGLLPAKCFKTWKAMMLDEYHDGSKLIRIGSQVLIYSGIYYQDSVILTSKGLQMEFVKILTVFTSLDFSSNNFEGTIPEELMNFTRLIFLNLSHNALAGQIPSSIGNLIQLESLDLSRNRFDGEIPSQLASLNFLSYLNLSYNRLVGKIPVGTQLQSFDASSYAGNAELCGVPLPKNCSDMSNAEEKVPEVHTDFGVKFDWTYVSIGVGFGVGAGLVVAPSLFLEILKKWSNHKIDKVLLVVLPMFGLTWIPIDDDEAEEDTEENNSDMEEECDYNEEQTILCHQRFQGRYCVLCSKLDIRKKKVIHDPRCTCYPSPPISTSTYPDSYSSHSHA